MNLCQDCITVKNDDREKEADPEFFYQGPSLDEYCLLNMALRIRSLGYFCERDSESVRIKQPDNTENSVVEYKILKYNDFDSKRKCASVVVRAPDGRIFAYVKGSDSTLFKMLNAEEQCKGQL